MIKINLLKNLGLSKSGGIAAIEASVDSLAPDSMKHGIAKLAAILLFPLGLIIYEKINVSEIEGHIAVVTAKLESLRTERQGFGDAGPRIEKYNKEKQRIDKELETVRELARNRLRELKALDAIQTLIPEKTWAKSIVFSGNSIRFDGYSSAEEGPTQMMRALESNVFFSKVEPKETTSEQTPNGVIKKFRIDFNIGRRE